MSLSSQIADIESSLRIEEILDNYITEFNSLPIPARNYSVLNRTALRTELSKYWCSSVYYEMTNILRTLVLGNQVIPQLMSTITDLQAISVNSVEGNVFIGGVQHIDKLVVVKYNKPSSANMTGVKHEFVIGTLLNTLRSRTPNFLYTYLTLACPSNPEPSKGDKVNLCESGPGKVVAQHLLIEYIEGKTLFATLGTLSVVELAKIFLCVFCSLAIANDAFHFCHGDLHGGNIMIRMEPRPVTLKYILPNGRTVIVNTKYVPVIIDYGFSRATHNNTEIVRPDYRDVVIVRSEPDAIIEEHPYLDFYKLFGFILLALRNGNYTNSHREFFMGWLESLRLFMTQVDYQRLYYLGTLLDHEFVEPGIPNILRRDNAKYPEIPENLLATDLTHFKMSIQQTYSYPLFIETRHLTYLDILNYLLRFADTNRVSELRCTPELELIERLYPSTRLPCNGENSPGFDKDGNVRTLFDCAKYFYDGMYNVLEFQQGTIVYHGSSSMAYKNVEFPLGNDYYETRDEEKGESAELLQRYKKIDLSFYGDLSIARDKSKGEGPNGFLCGDKCTYSYIAKKNMTFLDLSNPQTLLKLVNTFGEREAFLFTLYHGETYNYISLNNQSIQITPEAIGYINVALLSYTLPDDPSKQHFREFAREAVKRWKEKFTDVQRLPSRENNLLVKYHPLIRFRVDGVNRSSMNFPNYILPKIIMEYCEKNGYAGYAYIPIGKMNGEVIPGEIVLGAKVKTYLQRNYDDPYDWQYNDDKYIFGSIGKLLNDMKEYKTTDNNAGDLLEHSVWTALFVQWMYKVGHPSVQGIQNNSQFRKIVIAAAFLHDIGKAGDHVFIYQDKTDYAEKGANYIRNNSYLIKDGSVINMHEVIQEMGISLTNLTTLVFLIRWQWDIGNIIRETQRRGNSTTQSIAENIYRKYVQMCIETNINSWKTEMKAHLFMALYILWSANIMASQPFIGKASLKQLTARVTRNSNLAGLYFNEYLEEFPYIANLPKIHRGSNKYTEFGIQDVNVLTGDYAITGEGLTMRNIVVQKIYDEASLPSTVPSSVSASPIPLPVQIPM